jgi:hypothetical protein
VEVVLFVLVLSVVAVLAMHFGHDSRESAYSKEQESARYGVDSSRNS